MSQLEGRRSGSQVDPPHHVRVESTARPMPDHWQERLLDCWSLLHQKDNTHVVLYSRLLSALYVWRCTSSIYSISEVVVGDWMRTRPKGSTFTFCRDNDDCCTLRHLSAKACDKGAVGSLHWVGTGTESA